jgi:hypothetical protein
MQDICALHAMAVLNVSMHVWGGLTISTATTRLERESLARVTNLKDLAFQLPELRISTSRTHPHFS